MAKARTGVFVSPARTRFKARPPWVVGWEPPALWISTGGKASPPALPNEHGRDFHSGGLGQFYVRCKGPGEGVREWPRPGPHMVMDPTAAASQYVGAAPEYRSVRAGKQPPYTELGALETNTAEAIHHPVENLGQFYVRCKGPGEGVRADPRPDPIQGTAPTGCRMGAAPEYRSAPRGKQAPPCPTDLGPSK
jgi:hypothetical protein